jgi:DNA-binding MarR family transcriptional regulator
MIGRTAHSLAREIGNRGPFRAPEQEAYLNLLRTADELARDFSRLCRRFGITDSQYNALRILRGHGKRVSTRTIAQEMVSPRPDITRLVDRLERAGLATRQRGRDDRRIVWVTITAKGLNLLTKLDRPVLELHKRQLGHLGKQKLTTLSRLLFEARRTELKPAEAS